MAITQKDIAERLQLSRSLVAGVLNNRADVYASEETRRRVLEAAREMNYRPHAAARALRSGKTMVVTLAILPVNLTENPASSRPAGGWDSLIETMAHALGGHDYKLQIEMFASGARAREGLQELARSRSCDAVVLCGTEEVTRELAPVLEEAGVPFVTKGYFESRPDWPQIDFDHVGLMREAVAHLAALGHERIAYLGNLGDEVYARQLRIGFELAMRRRSASSALAPAPMERVGLETETRSVMRDWLRRPHEQRPTAVVIGTNAYRTWVECELALAEIGLQAGEKPGDFGLCGLHPPRLPLLMGQAHGFDQADFDHLASTLCQQLLLPILEGKTLESPIVRVMLPLSALPSLELHLHEAFASKNQN